MNVISFPSPKQTDAPHYSEER